MPLVYFNPFNKTGPITLGQNIGQVLFSATSFTDNILSTANFNIPPGNVVFSADDYQTDVVSNFNYNDFPSPVVFSILPNEQLVIYNLFAENLNPLNGGGVGYYVGGNQGDLTPTGNYRSEVVYGVRDKTGSGFTFWLSGQTLVRTYITRIHLNGRIYKQEDASFSNSYSGDGGVSIGSAWTWSNLAGLADDTNYELRVYYQ